ncbi:MAG: Cna B-type domain-containing protein [Anaerostipes hadrus]
MHIYFHAIFHHDSGKTVNGKRQYNVTTKAKYEIKPVSDTTVDYKVAKVWQDSNNKYQKRPENITVQLLRDGEVYQEVQLSEDNNWQYAWNDLSSKYQWEAIEKKKTKVILCQFQKGIIHRYQKYLLG